MGPNPKHCDTCGQDYDGRTKKCPYCADDVAFEADKMRRKSTLDVEEIMSGTDKPKSPTGGAAGTGSGSAGASPARVDLDRSISELGDLSGVIAEFRSLSTSMNTRMDRIERLVLDMNARIPAGAEGGQDGGGASGVTGATTTGGASGNTEAAATGGASVESGAAATGGSIKFNFTGTQEHRFPAMVRPDQASGGRPSMAGTTATPVTIQDGGGVGDNGASVDNGAEPENLDGANQPAALSKFDLRRFIPMSDRKKALVIESNEKLFYLLSRLLDDLGRKGFDVIGLVTHISYLTWMASTGIYTTEALCAYDYEMRERARQGGVGAFCGGDTSLTNMYLGASGTKQFKSTQSSYSGRQGGGNYNNNNSYRQGNNSRPNNLSGWKAVASRRGLCFAHAQGQQCNANCRYRHECTCGATDHNMLNCPRRREQGGDKGGSA